jgi:large subunit ribosomal protein L24
MSKWIRNGDQVVVIAGNDKGKTGKVKRRLKTKVIVEDVNMRKKHLRRTQETQGGRIVEMEAPIHFSNVRFCDKEGKPIKVRVKEEEGKKTLVYGAKGKETLLREI